MFLSYKTFGRNPFALILVFTIWGCVSKENSSAEKPAYGKLFTLSKIKDKEFLLDNLTSVDKIRTHYYTDGNLRTMYVLNYLNQTLQLYSWNGRLQKKIKLAKEGPNGVGTPYSIFVVNPDSIYTIDPGSLRLVLLDSVGRVRSRRPLVGNSSGKLVPGEGVLPLINVASQTTLFQGNLIMGGVPVDDCKRERFYANGFVGLAFNLKTNKIEGLMKMPDKFLKLYKEGYALSSQQAQLGQTYNLKDKKAILNFPTENDIYEIDLETKSVKSHYAGSERFNEIEYASKNLTDMRKEFDYFKNQPAFPAIYYDPYRNLYLRFCATPNPDKKEPFDEKPWVRQTLILLDKQFTKVGEEKLEDSNWQVDAFVTPEGIYIVKDTDEENKLIYTLYRITPVK